MAFNGPNGRTRLDLLPRQVYHDEQQSGTPGQLNPRWVESLMGFPAGWTRLRSSVLRDVKQQIRANQKAARGRAASIRSSSRGKRRG